MKLSEYFQRQKSQSMTSHVKSQLFSRIQKEKLSGVEVNTKLSPRAFFFASRKVIYMSIATILIFVVFGGLMLERNSRIDFGNFSIEKRKTTNGVLADYVAEIIEFNGEYSLVRSGLNVGSPQNMKLIENGDVITLNEGTDIVFTLVDGTKGKIVGPAEFSIQLGKKGYEIALVDGKFFRIFCPECVSEINVITPDLHIHQDKNQLLDIHIAKEDNGKMLVKNNGDDVIFTTKKDDNNKEILLTSKELISLNQDSETINITKDSDLMSAFMSKNDISATFTLSTDKINWSEVEQKLQKNDVIAKQININTKNDSNSENISDKKTEKEKEDLLLEGMIEIISSDLVITGDLDKDISAELGITTDEKRVPNSEQMKSLTTNLNTFFLMGIFESIYNNDKRQQNISKFADRINSIASSFGYSNRATSDLSSIKLTILSLKNQLEKEWYISPSYILQMEKTSNWCDELNNPTQQDWESLKLSLPPDLMLK